MQVEHETGIGPLASSRYHGFLTRCAAINCGVGVAIGLMGGLSEGMAVVLLAALGLIAATGLLRIVDACFDAEAISVGNGGRDRD